MAGLRYMKILKTPDNKGFVSRIYSALEKITDRAYVDAHDTSSGRDLKRDIEMYREQNGHDSELDVDVSLFRSREFKIQVTENVRKRDVYLVAFNLGYDGEYDSNLGTMKLGLINNALHGASARSIVNVIPEHPYDRQDRKSKPREPISAKFVADVIQASARDKLERVMTLDIHAPQIQGFYTVPVDNLSSIPVFAYSINNLGLDKQNLGVVSPDQGGLKRTEKFAECIGLTPDDMAVIIKKRPNPGESDVRYVVGTIKPIEIICDDKIDSGGTLIKGSAALREKGKERGAEVTEIYTCAPHAIFTENAEERLAYAGIKLIIGNTIPRSEQYWQEHKDITLVPMEYLLADAIFRTQTGQSTGPLFDADYVAELYKMFETKPKAVMASNPDTGGNGKREKELARIP